MKLIICLAAICSGCTTVQPPCADKPVYEKPKFEMPVRPQMKSTGNGTDGEIVRNLHSDVIDLTGYSTNLENLLKELK